MEIKTGLGNLPISRNGEVIIPRGVREIPDNAFFGSDITSVVIPNTVTRIGAQAFTGSHKMTKIKLPFGVAAIKERAFE